MTMEKDEIDEAITRVLTFSERMKRAKEAIDEEALEGEVERED